MSTTTSSPPNGEIPPSGDEKTKLESGANESLTSHQRQIRGIKWFLTVTAVLSSMFIYSLDNTITADLTPEIVNAFGSVPLLPWLSVGFMAGGVVVLLPVGKLYSKFNAKWLYIANLVVFLAASALCGAAPTMNAMIVGRVFLGVAGNGMYCGILTLLSTYTEEKERPSYLSLIGFVWGIGTVLGPVVGGAFAKVDWKWSFYINLIIGGLFAPVYLFILPTFNPLPRSVSVKNRLKDYDFLGAILFIGLVMSIVMAINFGGALYAWNSGSEIALFVVAGSLLIAFVVQQSFSWLTTPAERLFPVKMLRFREANLLFICASCCNTAGFIGIFYIPVYFQFTRGDNALDAAVRLLPLIIVMSATILANGHLMGKLGYYFPWYFVGSALALVGNVLLSRVDVDTPTANIYGYEVLVGFGTGCFIQAGYATIQTVVPPSDMGYALPFMMVAQFTGITAGLSVAGAVFVNQAQDALRSLLPALSSTEISAIISVADPRYSAIGTSSSAIDVVPENLQPDVLVILVDSLRQTFIPAYVGAAVALIISLFLNKKKAFRSTDNIPVTV